MRKEQPIRLQPSWKEALAIIDEVHRRAPASAVSLKCMLFFGIGQAEVQNIQGEHFDLEKRELHMFRAKTCKKYVIPLYDSAMTFVEELRARDVIVNGQKTFAWHNPRKALETACKALAMPSYSPRALRRTFIIQALEKGVCPRAIAFWQGHADARLVLSVYGRYISPADNARQVAKMEW